MDIRPILSTLLRHKTAAALIVLEIALSCAIVCNALFLIGNRLDHMQRPSGFDETHLVFVKANGITKDEEAKAVTRADLDGLRAIPGVDSATVVNQIPFGSSVWMSGIKLRPDQEDSTLSTTNYMVSEDGLKTLGLRLLEGRDFAASEYVDDGDGWIPSVIVSRALAQRLFPDQGAVGQSIYVFGNKPHRIVGIVEHLPRPRDGGAPAAEYDMSMLFPSRVTYSDGGTYALRVHDPAQRAAVLAQAQRVVASHGPTRIISKGGTGTMEDKRARYYRNDRAMAWLLVAVSAALLVVTALGIVGLASFWVAQRTRQIGVRRALGATKGQILRYFQTENFILATLGIVLGMVLAYAINQLLMSKYELPRLPLIYLPVGAVLLWLLGQIAVLWPARRAAAVPPAIATRSA
ncbi:MULTISPECIES: FtsX-like permease family protein [Pseudoxanthomonas]|uniref:ABC transport system permease protein n=1 Tax=Pseudoxanthomonas winnipegensis TaxID=2480810 RepID=A0AAW8GEY1_9GAMM|nr:MULTISPECIES: FtsX-like permease family protein [Pseudoxanthomonas]MDQ1120367.1 putative ABC transport system permease protein [Pseudoxanthomonas winnipegensis]MDQ1133584.1 putative ABC transport system permease protein [Pseudoxanthomonas winnipegensis]MDR6140175.1 putative ABC transport system permease protein [Pseudoxanthomonas sp. SORGH_AS_0997]